MPFAFTHPLWLWLLIPATAWTLWLAVKSDAVLTPWRRRVSLVLRLVLLAMVVLALSGARWKRPVEGMNAFFLLDRSDSVPSAVQDSARATANRWAKGAEKVDKAGYLVFGSDAALESEATAGGETEKIQAVVGGERTDIASAIRLGTAAFPESGQKRLVLLSDGNENVGDAQQALAQARVQGVTLDVLPVGTRRGGDVAVRKITLPAVTKKGATFEAKVFITADTAQPAKVRLLRNDRLLGEQSVALEPGKNLFTFPQKLEDPGFYGYEVQVEAAGDTVPQNNRATGFTTVRGTPRVLVVSAAPDEDRNLAAALRADFDVRAGGIPGFPATLAEMQDFDAIFLSNIAAGDLGQDRMRLLESAVRDFGVGLVAIGGDNAFTAGGYRGTPLESALPLEMELNSKKVLPSGALVLVMHGMEFANGNQVSREIALGALETLGPQDELGVVLWDGSNRWQLDLGKVGDKKAAAKAISGMNQGDLPDFEGLMTLARDGLVKSTASLKHIIVFSDGDPSAASTPLMESITGAKITVSTVMIGAHVAPGTMIRMAEQGRGRFYDVQSTAQLPQIFIKETAVILKSAIVEEPFRPRLAVSTEIVRGFAANAFPVLRGYVATGIKPRAEVPLVTDKGDPLLAHWQHGLGRSAAFTGDAKSRWAQDWLGWAQYRQFWSQVAGWVLKRVEVAEFNTEVSADRGEGLVSVEAVDAAGNFRNFLDLGVTVVGPRGTRSQLQLEQKGPGRYEGRFPTAEVGAYLLNLAERKDGRVVAAQVVGTSVNYSPEFDAAEPNLNLLERLATLGGGRVLDPARDNPFRLDRLKTSRPVDLWENLLRCMVVLFVFDVGVRRLDIDRGEWSKWLTALRIKAGLGGPPRPAASDESLAALLARRDAVRARRDTAATPPAPERLFQPRDVPAGAAPASPPPTADIEPTPPAAPSQPQSEGLDRLLAAKRKAKK
jgi:uncharacterized membrane protein